MDTSRAARRPAAPGGEGRPGTCRYCDKPCAPRARAHPTCRADYRARNVPAEVRERVLERDSYRCLDCGARARALPASMLEVDHDDELADGGAHNDLSNYVIRCLDHHDAKTQERRMARTATNAQTKTPATRNARAAQTAQLPDPPALGDTARVTTGLIITGAGLGALAYLLGHDYTSQAGPALTFVVLAAATIHGLRWMRWRRLCEEQRVYERLCKPAGGLPYAARRRHLKVNEWAGLTPKVVTVTPGRDFDPNDPRAIEALAAAFAGAIGARRDEVRTRICSRGRVRVGVSDQAAHTRAPQESARTHERAEAPAPPPPDGDNVTTRVRDALAGVLGDDCTVQVESWWPDGAPRTGTINYPPRATKAAREARADLPTVMGDAFAPRSEHGLWQFTWEPTRDRFRFADVPDALAPVVPLAPVDADVDLRRGVVLGVTEDGRPWRQPILEDHLLVAGTTGAGKGSVLWGIVRALAPLVTDGRCMLYVSDPKGGMEFGAIKPLAHRFVLRDGTAEMLEEAVADMTAQQRRLSAAGARKLEQPTRENPLRVIIVDELANFAGDKDVAALMATLLQQGRAVGVVVIGALQDARVKAIDNRDLFKSAIAMRLRARSQVDMVLGAGMRAAGAVCDRIPKPLPGIGYVVTEDHPDPVRVRAAFVPDEEIARLTAQPEPAPAHGARAQVGEQLALPEAARGGEPVLVGEVLSSVNAPAAVTAPSAPVLMRALTEGAHVLLPDDEDPVRIVSVEPDDEEPDVRVLVTYIYDEEKGERCASFERDDEARPV